MINILEENEEAARQAGAALSAIGLELAEGRIDSAFKSMEAARHQYIEWQELDKAILDIEDVVANRKNTLAVQQIITEIVSSVLGVAIRKAIS